MDDWGDIGNRKSNIYLNNQKSCNLVIVNQKNLIFMRLPYRGRGRDQDLTQIFNPLQTNAKLRHNK